MKLIGSKKLTAFRAGNCTPSCVRFLGRVEGPKVDFLPVHRDSRSEPTAPVIFINAARQFRGPTLIRVPSILGKGRLAQVRKSVVQAVKVFVIDVLRPFTGEHHPDHAVRSITSIIYADPDVLTIRRTRRFAWEALVPIRLRLRMRKMIQRAMLPRKRARLRIINKTLMQIRRIRLERHRQLYAMGALS